MYKTKRTPDWYAEAVLSMDDHVEFEGAPTDDLIHDAADIFLDELAKHHDLHFSNAAWS